MFSFIDQVVTRIARDDDGATMVEYGLMVGLIAAIAVGVITILGGDVTQMFQDIVDAINPSS